MKSTKLLTMSVSCLAFVLSACGGNSPNSEDAQTRASKIQDSFKVMPLGQLEGRNLSPTQSDKNTSTNLESVTSPASIPLDFGVDHYHISINRTALGQEFLLQGSWLTQDYIPAFQGMKSRVVYFKERGDQLVMIESSQGHLVHQDIPSTTILASFPILRSTDQEIVFDWAKGMSSLFIAYDWYSTDFFGPEYTPEAAALPITSSYIEDANFSSGGALVVRQISQVNGLVSLGIELKSNIETRYYLSPYHSNPNFRSIKTKGFDRMGYFEINPQLINGVDTTFVTKFDDKKPIVFAISDNTPAEYRQSIRDAVLYWNKALGKEVVQVVEAPAGLSAPNPDYNIIQWINWDSAGYAYADAQMDPFTGEVLHAQVFLTSAFAFHGKMQATQRIKTFKSEDSQNSQTHKLPDLSRKNFKKEDRRALLRGDSKPVRRIALKGFEQPGLCFRDETSHIRAAVSRLSLNHASDAQILKAAQDYLREVVAHEVGHALGLRHNFAGSLAANFAPDQREHLFSDYMKNGTTDADVVATSSVMDYQLFEESVMSGDLIAKAKEAFDYDHKAIDSLYNGKVYSNAEIPLFCTDSHIGRYGDCMPFDSGNSLFAFNLQQIKDSQRDFPAQLARLFVLVKTDTRFQGLSFEEIYLNPFSELVNFVRPEIDNLLALDADSSAILQVERKYDSLNQWNWVDIQKGNRDYVFNQMITNGGLAGLFPNFAAGYHDKLVADVKNLINDTEFTTAMSMGPKPFSFTDDEKKKILSLVSRGLATIESALSFADLWVTSFAKELLPNAKDAAGYLLASKATAYLVDTLGVELEEPISYLTLEGKSGMVRVKIPKFSYELPTRLQAIRVLDRPSKEYAADLLTNILGGAFGGVDPDTIDPSSLPEAVTHWLMENRGLINILRQPDAVASK